MGKKRGPTFDESDLAYKEDLTLPPVVRSRRERAVKSRLRSSEENTSHTDSGSGEHFSPLNVTEAPRWENFVV